MIKPDDGTQVISELMKLCFLMHYFVNEKHFFRKLTVNSTGAPNDGFLLKTLTILFRLSRVLLDL